MTPKEKAKELVEKFRLNVQDYEGSGLNLFKSKQCALITVDEMLGEYQSMSDLESKIVINDEVRFIVHQLEYWMLVKQEINGI